MTFLEELRKELEMDLPQEKKRKLRSLLARRGRKKFFTKEGTTFRMHEAGKITVGKI